MNLLREHIRNLLLEYGASDEVVIDVALKDVEESFKSGKSDGDIRGTIMQDVPLYRVIDDLGLSKIRETGKITSGDWSAPAESEKGAQFGFGLDDVVEFGLAHSKQRWFRHDDPKTGELGPKTYYPGRLRGGLWILEVNAAFNSFYTMSYSGRDKLVGNVNPFANPGDKKFDQETYDLIQEYLADKSKENTNTLIKHLSRLNLRLSKKGCDTGLGCSIDVDASDVIKVHKIEIDDAGGHNLVQMAVVDALNSIEGKDVSHKSTPFDVEEGIIRECIKTLLTEVPLDDFAYVTPVEEGDKAMVREEIADYFKAIPQSVNVYVAHTDDLSWAAHLPNTLHGKVSGFKLRGIAGVTDLSSIRKSYPQIGRKLDPSAINLLYIYPKTYEADGGSQGSFVPDVNPHYLAHDLHHMIESTPVGKKSEDKFFNLIKEYLLELATLSFGDNTFELKVIKKRIQQTGRRLGSIDPRLMYDELFPGINKPSGDPDLVGDIFADYLLSGGQLTLGVPEQIILPGVDYDLSADERHDKTAIVYEQKFQDLFDTLLDPLVGKVAYFNAFEVNKPQTEKAAVAAKAKMQADHGLVLDYVRSLGGEFRMFGDVDDGREELQFEIPLKTEDDVWNIEDFKATFPKETDRIETLGYEIFYASTGFTPSAPIVVYLKPNKSVTNEVAVREYIKGLLAESLTRSEIENAIADASFNSGQSSTQHRWGKGQPIIDYVFDERNDAWKYTATIPDESNNADKWPSFSSDPEEDLETFLSHVAEPIQLNLLEQTGLREYISGLLKEDRGLLGTCVNSFDGDGYCIQPGIPYETTSDLAVGDENAEEISEEEFRSQVVIPSELEQKVVGHEVYYLLDRGNDHYMLYDSDDDVHYFFGGS